MQRIQMSSVRASLAVFVGVAAFGTAQADFPIRVTADSDRDAVTVYNDSTGEYLAAGYQDGGSPLFDKPIFVQRLSADGTPIGGAKKVWDFGAYPFDLAYNPSRADFMLAVSYHFFIGSEAIYVVNIDDLGDLNSQTPVMQGVLDPGPNFDAGRPGAQPINIAYNSIAQEYLVTAQLTWESGGTEFYRDPIAARGGRRHADRFGGRRVGTVPLDEPAVACAGVRTGDVASDPDGSVPARGRRQLAVHAELRRRDGRGVQHAER
jgi:hypothetical protein